MVWYVMEKRDENYKTNSDIQALWENVIIWYGMVWYGKDGRADNCEYFHIKLVNFIHQT